MSLIERYAKAVVGRDGATLFDQDMADHHDAIKGKVKGSNILVVGGGGSIGSATVRELLDFSPASLSVVDQDENGLAELVREIRSASGKPITCEFRTLPIDFGSTIMKRFLESSGPFDLVLNFAALKHVRSEKDVYSLLQMIDTNLVKASRFIGWLSDVGFRGAYFCVSTDKAANPVNLMGASKRLMEMLVFSENERPLSGFRVASARFANVAFSNGSLLHSFLQRFEKGQPLSVPEHTKRYFITPKESGQICLLAATCAPDRHLLFPDMNPEDDLIEMQSIAQTFVNEKGLQPRFYRNEDEAKKNCYQDIKNGYYPVLLTPLNTSGEKEYEEFVGKGETVADIGMKKIKAVKCATPDHGALRAFINRMDKLLLDSSIAVEKAEITKLISDLIPEFSHVETGKNLDQRM